MKASATDDEANQLRKKFLDESFKRIDSVWTWC
jgi:hypothetical protein